MADTCETCRLGRAERHLYITKHIYAAILLYPPCVAVRHILYRVVIASGRSPLRERAQRTGYGQVAMPCGAIGHGGYATSKRWREP